VIDLLYDILDERTVHLQGDSLDCMDVEVVGKVDVQSEWQTWERLNTPLTSAHLPFLELPHIGSFLALSFALK